LTNVTRRAPAARDDEEVARTGAGIGRGRAVARAGDVPRAPLAADVADAGWMEATGEGWAAVPPPGDEQPVSSAPAVRPATRAASRHDRFPVGMNVISAVPCWSCVLSAVPGRAHEPEPLLTWETLAPDPDNRNLAAAVRADPGPPRAIAATTRRDYRTARHHAKAEISVIGDFCYRPRAL